MKRRIVCFGDSNTWGLNAEKNERFQEDIRWTSLLGQFLGEEFDVVEEGLSGRTTIVDDPLFEGRKGLDYLHPCLLSHSPLELVIIMLGTNDTKERIHLSSINIAQGITKLAVLAKNTPVNKDNTFPKVLVIAPPPIGAKYYTTQLGKTFGKNCDIKSEEFPVYLEEFSKENGFEFLDTKGIVHMHDYDYIHLNEEGHHKLAELVYEKVKGILQ
ncbi:GDSL-type esterase/lipase family protein [Bacillus nitroreducens]